jgi:hypothetical protein
MNEYQQAQLIANIVGKAIENGQIKLETPPVQHIVQEAPVEKPSYTGGRVTFFDLLTCIMFTLNLIGVTNINWFLVFLPFAFPYIVFYGMLWGMMLWVKIKTRKNKENGKGKTN